MRQEEPTTAKAINGGRKAWKEWEARSTSRHWKSRQLAQQRERDPADRDYTGFFARGRTA